LWAKLEVGKEEKAAPPVEVIIQRSLPLFHVFAVVATDLAQLLEMGVPLL